VLAVIFFRCLLWISVVTSAILPEVLRGFPQSLKTKYMKVHHLVHDPSFTLLFRSSFTKLTQHSGLYCVCRAMSYSLR